MKSYTEGEFTTLQPSDLSDSQVSFYWTEGSYSGSLETIEDHALVNGVAETATALFNVFRPEVNSFTITNSTVSLLSVNGKEALTAGDISSQPPEEGSTWDASVSNPSNAVPGKIAYTQLANVYRQSFYNGDCLDQAIDSGIDSKHPPLYDFNQPLPVSVDINAGDMAAVRNYDSPFQELSVHVPISSSKLFEVNDSFDLYLMFKPNTKNSIWVTLSKASWGWHAAAEWPANASGWILEPGNYIDPPGESTGSDSTELPVWTQVANTTMKPCP